MFKALVALVMVAGSLTAGATPVAAEAAPVESMRVVETAVDLDWASDHKYGAIWVANELETAGVVVPANVTVIITDTNNCGSEISPDGVGGGCTLRWHDGTISVLVSATAIEDGTGAHILFHELGHAMFNLGECAAEYFAHNYSAADQWSYLECNV